LWTVLEKLEEFYAIGGGCITLGDPHGENFDGVCTLIILTSCLYTQCKEFFNSACFGYFIVFSDGDNNNRTKHWLVPYCSWSFSYCTEHVPWEL